MIPMVLTRAALAVEANPASPPYVVTVVPCGRSRPATEAGAPALCRSAEGAWAPCGVDDAAAVVVALVEGRDCLDCLRIDASRMAWDLTPSAQRPWKDRAVDSACRGRADFAVVAPRPVSLEVRAEVFVTTHNDALDVRATAHAAPGDPRRGWGEWTAETAQGPVHIAVAELLHWPFSRWTVGDACGHCVPRLRYGRRGQIVELAERLRERKGPLPDIIIVHSWFVGDPIGPHTTARLRRCAAEKATAQMLPELLPGYDLLTTLPTPTQNVCDWRHDNAIHTYIRNASRP